MASKTANRTNQAAPAVAVDAAGAANSALLQRVILPRTGDPLDVRALYLDEDQSNEQRSRAMSRTALRIPERAGVSFASYFNAFPASYWRRWTTVSAVELRLSVDGPCRVDIYRSKADGAQIHVSGRVLDTAGPVSFELDLTPFEDGGWYWFDLTTDDQPVTVTEAAWYATTPAPRTVNSVAIAITTYNRPDDCVGALQAIGEDPLVLASVGAVIVADQGNKKVRDAKGFDIAQQRIGDRLRIKDQGNLGGSGGFARGMYEALTGTDCDQVLLMDDDIVIEPDAILRALAFSRFAERPMIVGGQMLNLQARSHLHSMGEVIDRYKFAWRPAPNAEYDHDFEEEPLRDEESAKLHRRIDVDYNGWWMCLIPRSIIEEIGLPLPLFIKWDDSEYGLRASAAGYPTASLPGVAIWHMPWTEKDDVTDWQAYFHLRNRLVVAAMYGPARPEGLFKHTMKMALKHLISLEYSTVALHDRAIQDFLAGPSKLFDLLPTALPEIRELRSQYADGTVLPSAKQFPLPTMDPLVAEHFLKPPTNPVTIGRTLASGLVHNLLPVKTEHHERPQLNISAQDARWFLLAKLDGATVSTADGRGVTYRKRDQKMFWSMLRRSAQNHATLLKEFPRLAQEYRRAKAELTSLESWRKVFEG